jgi:hypothetical protein
MGLNLIVLLILGAATSSVAFFVGRATNHAAAGRFVSVALWLLMSVALAIDLVTSERRARARGVHPRRSGHLVAMGITAFVAGLVWLITNR